MAVLKQPRLPGMKIIDGFKGTLDFYYYMDIPCCRKWPESKGRSQTAASVAQQPAFAYVARLWDSVSPFVKEAYDSLAFNCGLHRKDWFTRGYYGKIYRYPTDYSP